jgi:hypothetical protein
MRISVLTPCIRPHRLKPVYESLKRQTFKDFEWLVEFGLSDTEFTLPKDMNKMISRANGEIVVIWQDSIEAPDDFLQKVVGRHSPGSDIAITYPVGKRRADGVEWDWRRTRDGEVGPHEWETDLGSCPRQMLLDIGGYDERFSSGWSWDNVEVGYRAKAAGYHFWCDSSVEAVADDHDATDPHPFRVKLPPNFPKANETKARAEAGDYRLDFLSRYN